jgi:hypothetical protein
MEPTEMISLVGVMGTVGYTTVSLAKMTLSHIRHQKLANLQSATMSKIVDKLGTSPELLAWLQTGDLKKFLDVERLPSAVVQSPHSRILNAMQAGAVLTAGGLGLLAVPRTESNWETLGFLSPVVLAVGVGFLAAAAASYLLSAKLGLVPSAERE